MMKAINNLTPKYCLNNLEGTFETLKKNVDRPILPGTHTGQNILTDFWSWGYSFWDDEEDFLERLTEAANICADAGYFYVGSHHIKAWMDYYVIQCLKTEEKFIQIDDVYSVFSVDMSNCGNKIGDAGLTFGGSAGRQHLWAVYDACVFIHHSYCHERDVTTEPPTTDRSIEDIYNEIWREGMVIRDEGDDTGISSLTTLLSPDYGYDTETMPYHGLVYEYSTTDGSNDPGDIEQDPLRKEYSENMIIHNIRRLPEPASGSEDRSVGLIESDTERVDIIQHDDTTGTPTIPPTTIPKTTIPPTAIPSTTRPHTLTPPSTLPAITGLTYSSFMSDRINASLRNLSEEIYNAIFPVTPSPIISTGLEMAYPPRTTTSVNAKFVDEFLRRSLFGVKSDIVNVDGSSSRVPIDGDSPTDDKVKVDGEFMMGMSVGGQGVHQENVLTGGDMRSIATDMRPDNQKGSLFELIQHYQHFR